MQHQDYEQPQYWRCPFMFLFSLIGCYNNQHGLNGTIGVAKCIDKSTIVYIFSKTKQYPKIEIWPQTTMTNKQEESD